MTFYERFEQLCRENGLKPQSREMQEIAGVSSPAISNWKQKHDEGKDILPNAEVLCRIAIYFKVSTDYLLGLSKFRNSSPVPTLTEQETILLKAYRAATAQGQFRIVQVCMNEWDCAKEKREIANAG